MRRVCLVQCFFRFKVALEFTCKGTLVGKISADNHAADDKDWNLQVGTILKEHGCKEHHNSPHDKLKVVEET